MQISKLLGNLDAPHVTTKTQLSCSCWFRTEETLAETSRIRSILNPALILIFPGVLKILVRSIIK